MENKNEVAKFAYEMTYHRYLLSKDNVRSMFTEVDATSYIVLHSMIKFSSDQDPAPKKTYLADLADRMELSIRAASRMVSNLKEKGLVEWSHDGNGSEGTYIIITKCGLQAMRRQEEILKQYYGKVIETFGYDNMIQLLQQIEKLEDVMDEVFSKEGVDAYDRDTVE